MNPDAPPAPEKPWWRTVAGTPPGYRKPHRVQSSRFLDRLGAALDLVVIMALLWTFDSWRHRLTILAMMSLAYILGIRRASRGR